MRRVLVALGFVVVCFFFGNAASWATTIPGPDPSPMPSPYGVADGWKCVDVAPDPVVTPTPPPDPPLPSPTSTAQRCAVTSWATPAPPEPVPTVTETVDPSEGLPSDVRVVEVGPTAQKTIFDNVWPLLFLVGVLAITGVATFVIDRSKPPTFGIGG